MLSANFKPKRTAAASRGFLATARLSCYWVLLASLRYFVTAPAKRNLHRTGSLFSAKNLQYLIEQRVVDTMLLLTSGVHDSKYTCVPRADALSACCKLICAKMWNVAKRLWNRVCSGRSRSSKVVDFGTYFPLDINSNFAPILPRFRDIADFLLKTATPSLFHPNFVIFSMD